MSTAQPINVHAKLPRRLADRREYLVAKCRGKRVLHLGCVDFATSDGWEARFRQQGLWLHDALAAVAREIIGIDNAKAAVDELRSRYGRQDIHFGDAEHLDALDFEPFELIVAGEVIEHLPNPGLLLRSARQALVRGGLIIITTINTYCLRRFLRIPFGRESVHRDHVAYYSHATLRRLAELHGYAVVEQLAYRLPNRRPLLPYIVDWLASAISPNLAEGLICTITPEEAVGR